MTNWKGIIGRGFRPQDFGDYVGTLKFYVQAINHPNDSPKSEVAETALN